MQNIIFSQRMTFIFRNFQMISKKCLKNESKSRNIFFNYYYFISINFIFSISYVWNYINCSLLWHNYATCYNWNYSKSFHQLMPLNKAIETIDPSFGALYVLFNEYESFMYFFSTEIFDKALNRNYMPSGNRPPPWIIIMRVVLIVRRSSFLICIHTYTTLIASLSTNDYTVPNACYVSCSIAYSE